MITAVAVMTYYIIKICMIVHYCYSSNAKVTIFGGKLNISKRSSVRERVKEIGNLDFYSLSH